MSELRLTPNSADPTDTPVGKIDIYIKNGEAYTKAGIGAAVKIGGIFGDNYTFKKKTSFQSSSSANYTVYLTLPVVGMDITGTYRVGLTFTWGYSQASRDFKGALTIDNVIYGEEFIQEPKDPADDQRQGFTSFTIIEPGEFIANSTFKFEFAASNNSDTARVYAATMEIWRVK